MSYYVTIININREMCSEQRKRAQNNENQGFTGVRERHLEKSKLAKCIKKCRETDTHVENYVKCRGIAQKSRKCDSEKALRHTLKTVMRINKIMNVEPKG